LYGPSAEHTMKYSRRIHPGPSNFKELSKKFLCPP
jgi:hypothetical protein